MSKGSINKVILIGNLGADPEMRYMPSGSGVATINIATTESWKDKESGEAQDRTEWHRVVMFNRLAEIAHEYLKKGAKVFIEGKLRTRKWQDKTGVDRYTTEIVADEMQMLSGSGGGGAPRSSGESASRPAGTQSAAAPPADAFDDDIPF